MMSAVYPTDAPEPPPEWSVFAEWMGTLRDLDGMSQLLDWDQETVMPARGAEGRARLLGTVAALAHRELVRGDVGDVLDVLAARSDLDVHQAAMVRVALRDRARALRVPEGLVREESELSSRCTSVWRAAREADDVTDFMEALRPLVGVKRDIAQILSDTDDPYDGLLDLFEPGARAAELEPLFDDLCERLVPVVHAAHHSTPVPDTRGESRPPHGTWPEEAQLELASSIARMVGFDGEGGAIGITAHPFTTIHHLGDVRFSTHVDVANPATNVLVVLHEAGHAMYDQGLPSEHARTCLFEAPSMGAQESQSRFYEMHVGCSTAFWRCLEPDLRRLFPTQMQGRSVDDLAAGTRVVRPGTLRLEADEVTYNLHIAVRFRLEAQLIRGALEVEDLPEAWSDGVNGLLGVRPVGHRDGILQDIHWAAGLFGYFPTYTLGNIYAAQLRAALEDDLGPLDGLIERREFDAIRRFMRERVHSQGSLLGTAELMQAATGRPQRADELVAHLERRYLPS